MRIKISTSDGLINIILVLVIAKITLFMVVVLFDQIFNYKNIFANVSKFYYAEPDLNISILSKQKTSNITMNFDLLGITNKIGFLPDNASFLCQDGLEIYKFNKNRVHGYFGFRVVNEDQSISELITGKEQYYQVLLDQNKNIKVKKLQMIDSKSNNKVDQILLMDYSNRTWLYNVALDQVFLVDSKYSSEEYVDYIVINQIFNLENRTYQHDYNPGLIIFLHSRGQFKDYIDIFYVSLERYSKRQLTKLCFNNHLAKFKIYRDYMVVFYEDSNLPPNAYKIHVSQKNSIALQKMNIEFYLQSQQLKNCIQKEQESTTLPQISFLWNQKLFLHQAIIVKKNCLILKYNFNLPTDQGIVSFRTIDY